MQDAANFHETVLENAEGQEGQRDKHEIAEGVKIDPADGRDIKQHHERRETERKENVFLLQFFRLVDRRFNLFNDKDEHIYNDDKPVNAEGLEGDPAFAAVSPAIYVKARKIVRGQCTQ
jgi:hypothetical protein